MHSSRSADTDLRADVVVSAHWRAVSIAERAAATMQLCADVERLARAGILARRPALTEREICHELARRRYGATLADAAYAHRNLAG